MKKTSFIFLAILLAGYVHAQTNWAIDPVHSKVNFTVDHLVISEVDGTFRVFNGSMQATKDDFTDAIINFEIDATSINTDNDKRDGHLRSEDFFYTEKYPKIIFSSSSFKKVSDNEYKLTGNLTMRGVTKQVSLIAKYGGKIVDGYGNTRIAFKVSGELNRIDYGVAWNAKIEHGGLTVGEEVALNIKLELIKQ